MTTRTITQAIGRSISHNEIVHIDLSDMAATLRTAAAEAGDHAMVAQCDAENAAEIVAALIDGIDDDLGYDDDVVSDTTHEMWGVAVTGHAWRVHIDLAR